VWRLKQITSCWGEQSRIGSRVLESPRRSLTIVWHWVGFRKHPPTSPCWYAKHHHVATSCALRPACCDASPTGAVGRAAVEVEAHPAPQAITTTSLCSIAECYRKLAGAGSPESRTVRCCADHGEAAPAMMRSTTSAIASL